MADIMQDVLNLNYSPSFDIQGMQEADINLSLSPSVAASATVYGTVTDGTNPCPTPRSNSLTASACLIAM